MAGRTRSHPDVWPGRRHQSFQGLVFHDKSAFAPCDTGGLGWDKSRTSEDLEASTERILSLSFHAIGESQFGAGAPLASL